MKIHNSKPLFAWADLDESPTLNTVREFLECVPDTELLLGLERARGKGRNDFPVRVLWGVLLLTTALRHTTVSDTLAELRRNSDLRRLLDLRSETAVPQIHNMSRFVQTLGTEPHLARLKQIFNTLIQALGGAIDSLGRHTAGDSTALSARRSAQAQAEIEAARAAGRADPVLDEHGLPLPTGGRKEYRDDQGRVSSILEWFGYKLHLLVDVEHEVVLSYEITSTKTGDNETLRPLVDQALTNLPEGRIETLAYDKAADDAKVHAFLNDEEIKPVIQIRSSWINQTEKLVPGQETSGNIVHDEAGTVYCVDTVSSPPVKQKMAYIGHEPQRGTLKYRCPAMHGDYACPMSSICNAGKTYGRTVRVDQSLDLRRFPSLPRGTKKFETLYKGRTAVERVNARLKIFWGADDGNVAGAARFHAHVGVLLVVHAAFATLLAAAPRHDGTLGQTRLSTVAKALRSPENPVAS